jgi:uncharacterized protein YjbI with pentapeptide repeats
MLSVSLKKLKKYGYNRTDFANLERDNRTIYKKNLQGMSLNHSFIEYAEIKECNFDLASITGSIYRHCSFVDNSMSETDFEFCEFSDCNFHNKTPISCSYNNSNFINTRFYNISFDTCTFTSAYFDECHFLDGRIKYSTLENSCFKDCIFENIDFSRLNMDFVELKNPHMINVILPMSQIPFMYGCLDYLLNTKEAVKISKGESSTMSSHEYFEKVVPLMEKYFNESKQYFPLSNIYLSLNKEELAIQTLKKGLSMSIENRDYRMLKYYCYLIAKSSRFKPDILHMFYNNICRLSPQGRGALNEQKNYTRHIGEIKTILFDQTSSPNLNVTVKTDIQSNNVSKLSYILETIFKMSKTDIGYGVNKVETLITENSPLVIELRVSGNENSLIYLLIALTKLLDVDNKISMVLPCAKDVNNHISEFYKNIEEYRDKIKALSISLVLVEYYLGNFRNYLFDDAPCYYYNSLIGSTTALLN